VGFAAQDFIVACCAYVVPGAGALIGMTLLSADWDAGKIIAPGYTGFCTQRQHDLLPFGAVRPYSVCAIQNIHNIMCHLMGYGCCDVVIKILGEQIRVVANNAVSIVHLVHASCASFKVEQYRDHGQFVGIYLAGSSNELASCCADLLLTLVVYRFNHRVFFRICH